LPQNIFDSYHCPSGIYKCKFGKPSTTASTSTTTSASATTTGAIGTDFTSAPTGSTTSQSDSTDWCAEDMGKDKCVIDDVTVHMGACQNGVDSHDIQCLPPNIFESYRCPSGLSKCKFGKPSTTASTGTTTSATTTGAISTDFTTTTTGSTAPRSDSTEWCAEDMGKDKCVVDDVTVHMGACQNGVDSHDIQCLPPNIFDSYRCPLGLFKCKFGRPSTTASTGTTTSATATTTGTVTTDFPQSDSTDWCAEDIGNGKCVIDDVTVHMGACQNGVDSHDIQCLPPNIFDAYRCPSGLSKCKFGKPSTTASIDTSTPAAATTQGFTTTTTFGTTPKSDSMDWCAEGMGKGKCVIDDVRVHMGACQNGVDSHDVQCFSPNIFDSYRCPSGLSKCRFGKLSITAMTATTTGATDWWWR
jgi:hypothetical protein